MNKLFIFLSILFYVASGVGGDDVSASVMEGDSVTLNTNVKTNLQDEVAWYFNNTRIARITRHSNKACTDVQCNAGTERFRGRLELDQTGSLTITDTRTTDSGLYKLVIISSKNITEKTFKVAFHGAPAAQRDNKKTKSVLEGESVTLDPRVTESPNHVMTWYFNDTLIAEITGDQSRICSDRFQDRLKLEQTEFLTITNTRTTDSGLYQLKISSSSSNGSSSLRLRPQSIGVTCLKSFSVFVTAVPDSGLSPAAVGGICVVLLLLVCAAAGALARRRGLPIICSKSRTQAVGCQIV